MLLKNKVVIVTGSARGIGSKIVEEFLRNECFVAGYDLLSPENIGQNERYYHVNGDVRDLQKVDEFVKGVIQKYGKIDILVNNAGITRDKTLKNMTETDWNEVVDINLKGTFNFSKSVVPFMIENKSGSIISIASVVAQAGAFGQTNYAASKAGIIGFTKSLALELAKHGITVNAVCPGYTNTEMTKKIPSDVVEKIINTIPLRRFAEPEEIAKLIRFIAFDGHYITGNCININGGSYLQ